MEGRMGWVEGEGGGLVEEGKSRLRGRRLYDVVWWQTQAQSIETETCLDARDSVLNGLLCVGRRGLALFEFVVGDEVTRLQLRLRLMAKFSRRPGLACELR
jgi:hypothetical protein